MRCSFLRRAHRREICGANTYRVAAARSLRALLGWLVAVFMMCACKSSHICVLYGTPVSLPLEAFVGEWTGFIESDYGLYRLELRTNHTGVLTAVYADNRVVQYPVDKWVVLTNSVIDCHFSQTARASPFASLQCSFHHDRLLGVLRGLDGWRETISFRQSRLLEERLKLLHDLSIPRP